MNMENNKDKNFIKKKYRKLAEAAKTVLEQTPQKALDHNEILLTIQNDKDISGTVPLDLLDTVLHANAKGSDCTFYKVLGRLGAYGLMSSIPDGGVVHEMEDDRNLDVTVDGEGELVDLQDRPLRDLKNEKVIFVKLPDDIPPSPAADLPQEDKEEPPVETVSQLVQSAVPPAKPTRTSKRNRKHCIWQHKRRKKAKVVPKIPKLTIKQIPQPKESKQDFDYSSMNSSSDKRQRPCLRTNTASYSHKPTFKELLSSIPQWKPRKRTHKKLSTAAQIAQTKEGCIDLETPDSILVNINLRALLTKHNFLGLPSSYQYSLIQLLPECDRIVCADKSLRLNPSALNNEFFTKACNEWKQRLADGEFTPENQIRIKQEEEKEQARLDPWKVKHFEPVWGQKSASTDSIPVPASSVLSTVLPSTPPKTTSPLKIHSPHLSSLIKQTSSATEASSTDMSKSVSQTAGLSNISLSLPNTMKSEPGSVTKNSLLLESLKRPLDVKTDTIIPTKRLKPVTQQRIVPNKVQSQVKFHRAKTLAQIKAQTAERKAQTAAARGQTGQTRTLAQIKAQTKAKLLARASIGGSSEDKQRHVPNIIQSGQNKSGINLQRSYQICQAMIEKSINSGNMASKLNKSEPNSDGRGAATEVKNVITEPVQPASAATMAVVTSQSVTSPLSPFVQPTSPPSVIQIKSPPSPAVSPRSHLPVSQQIQVVRNIPSPVMSAPSQPPSVTTVPALTLAQSVNLQAIQTSRPTILRIRSPSAASSVTTSTTSAVNVSKAVTVSQPTAVMKTVYVAQGVSSASPMPQVISTAPTSTSSVMQIKSVAPTSPAGPAPPSSPVILARPAPPSSPASQARPQPPSSPLARPSPTISPATQLRQLIVVPATSVKTSVQDAGITQQPLTSTGISNAVAQSIQSQLLSGMGMLPSTSKLILVTTSPSSNSNLCALLQPAKQAVAATTSAETQPNHVKMINTSSINTNKNANTVKPSHFLSCTILKNSNPKSRTIKTPPASVGPARSSSVPPQTNGIGPPRAASAPPPVEETKADGLIRSFSLNGSTSPIPEMNKENDKVVLTATAPSTIKTDIANSLGISASQLIKIATKSSGQLTPHVQTVQIPATATLKLRPDGSGYQVVKADSVSLASGVGVTPQLLPSGSIVTLPTSTSDSGNSNCPCSLKAMVMCKKCGAFCHDDCIGPYILCANCVSAT